MLDAFLEEHFLTKDSKSLQWKGLRENTKFGIYVFWSCVLPHIVLFPTVLKYLDTQAVLELKCCSEQDENLDIEMRQSARGTGTSLVHNTEKTKVEPGSYLSAERKAFILFWGSIMFDRYDVRTVVWEELKYVVKNKKNKEN